MDTTQRRPDGTIMPKLPRPVGEPIRRPSKPKPPRKRKPRKVKPPKARFTPSIIPEAALAQCAVLGSTAGPRGELARELLQRHPYIMAQKLFVAGLLLSGQAAALAATDGDFIGECFYQHKNAREEAARIVRDVWSLELVANMTSGRTI